ncbi:MAG: HAD-IA family hydrolase [Chromatiales bacterium]
MKTEPIEAVFFDLDGTLADTAQDLAYALNETLRHHGHRPLAYEKIRPVVSYGGTALIRLGFGIEPDHVEFENYRQFLLGVYEQHLCLNTRLFDGMDEVLEQLEQRGIPWGVVTNKPAWLTDPLMQQMGLTSRAACIVSGDTCRHNKPHPEPVLHACRLTGAEPANSYYVGDAERDIEAGRAAGCITVAALFGYLTDQDDPTSWHADLSINQPLELLDHL